MIKVYVVIYKKLDYCFGVDSVYSTYEGACHRKDCLDVCDERHEHIVEEYTLR